MVNEVGDSVGPFRVYQTKTKEVGGLAMSRSIGDTLLNESGVISSPEIREILLVNEDKFAILASDGIWEVINNRDAVHIVASHWNKGDSPYVAWEDLVKSAKGKWKQLGNLYVDDTIINIICFISFILQQ